LFPFCRLIGARGNKDKGVSALQLKVIQDLIKKFIFLICYIGK
jgi:hypothetical protein